MFLPLFEELYVVSDLHLGGTRSVPIFRQGQELASLIEGLGRHQPSQGGSVGLVLNGDVIDTLAEEVPGYVASPLDAEETIAAIVAHEAFSGVWSALEGFVSRERHKLVIVIGNHDLELAYPNVQEALLTRIAGHDDQQRGRISFVASGAGYRCAVGPAGPLSASVLCVHGNEFDCWNAVSPESMNRLVRAATLGRESPLLSEPPNAGTQLVKDVMNAIKRDWPFVDLLKPEIDSVFTILLALDPKRVGALGGVLRALAKAMTVGETRVGRVLGGPEPRANEEELQAGAAWRPGEHFGKFLGRPSAGTPGTALRLDAAWEMSGQPDVTPEQLAGEAGEVLGVGTVLRNLLRFSATRIASDRCEALRAALADWGGGQETWELDGACGVFDKLTELAPDADVVVAGHTHLRRQKRFPGPGGPLYLNTGTWARLMRLAPKNLEQDGFAALYQALSAKSMKALDGLPTDVMLNQPTVAVIRFDDQDRAVKAALCEAPLGTELPLLVAGAAWTKVGGP